MPDLFGLDIAGIVNSEIVGAGNVRTGTLTRITPGARGSTLIGGNNPTETTHSFNGFVETKTARSADSLSEEPMAVLSILGASVSPAATPQVGDTALIDGTLWDLVELMSRDPAGALFEFKVEASQTEGA